MSLALLEEEHSLEAALAFLDSCGEEQLDPPFDVAFDLDALLEEDDLVLDSPTSDPESIGSAAHSSNTASSDNSGRQVVARSKPTRQRATRKCKAVGPAAPRRRTSTDILELREQVIQLTTRIDQLNKRPRAQPIGSGFHSNHITQGARLQARDAQGSSLELGGIVLEREKLREAELLNAKLKVAWRRQLKLCQQLENVFKKGFAPSVRPWAITLLCSISLTPGSLYLFSLCLIAKLRTWMLSSTRPPHHRFTITRWSETPHSCLRSFTAIWRTCTRRPLQSAYQSASATRRECGAAAKCTTTVSSVTSSST